MGLFVENVKHWPHKAACTLMQRFENPLYLLFSLEVCVGETLPDAIYALFACQMQSEKPVRSKHHSRKRSF